LASHLGHDRLVANPRLADLDGEREPSGEANVHEAELAIEEEVQTQALAAGRNDPRPTLAIGELEASAGRRGCLMGIFGAEFHDDY